MKNENRVLSSTVRGSEEGGGGGGGGANGARGLLLFDL